MALAKDPDGAFRCFPRDVVDIRDPSLLVLSTRRSETAFLVFVVIADIQDCSRFDKECFRDSLGGILVLITLNLLISCADASSGTS